MESGATNMQAFFALLGSNDRVFDEFRQNPMAVIANSDLSNDDKFFLLTMGPANRNDRIVYSFNFSQDQIELMKDEEEGQFYRLKGTQFNIQKGDRIQLPHVIDGSINLDTFELKMDVKHGEILPEAGEESSSVRIGPDTSVVHTFAFSKDNIRLYNGDFIILGTQDNIDVVSSDVKDEAAGSEEVKMPPHRINGSFDEKLRQLSINVFLDNPEA